VPSTIAASGTAKTPGKLTKPQMPQMGADFFCIIVTAYAVVLSLPLDVLRFCHTPPLAPLPASGEGTGVGFMQHRAVPKENAV